MLLLKLISLKSIRSLFFVTDTAEIGVVLWTVVAAKAMDNVFVADSTHYCSCMRDLDDLVS